MRQSTLDNVYSRYKWLKSKLVSPESMTKAEYNAIVDMRSFCNLSVNQQFIKQSYNSIKSAAQIALSKESDKDGWELLLELRSAVHDKAKAIKPSRSISERVKRATKSKNEAINRKMESEANAQLCLMAYMELFNEINEFLRNSKLPPTEKQQLINILEVSKLKFNEIVSPECTQKKPTLAVIRGDN